MYSHERDRQLRENKGSHQRKKDINIEDYVLKKMEEIDKGKIKQKREIK